MIAALFVETDGCYFGLPDVDPWDEARDARIYAGPHKIVAHPPCKRWGRYWHGSPRKPHQFELGADDGCFASALKSINRWGGVLEHPAYSHAWTAFGITKPSRDGGWVQVRTYPWAFTCHVEQGHYGHLANKATWLYAAHVPLPELIWGRGAQRLDPVILARYGYEYARRCGIIACMGGKDKIKKRNATPPAFRDVLLNMCRG